MAPSKEYLHFISEQLSELEDIGYRAMTGEYTLYYKGKIIGGIYDDRLLVKSVKSAENYMTGAKYERSCEGAKKMLLVDNVDDKDCLAELFRLMFAELHASAAKKKRSDT